MSVSRLADLGAMSLVRGGVARLGSTRFYPEESPVVEIAVPDVRWDVHPVTNAEFAAFVEGTGHVTVAEAALEPADFPGADPELLVPGSLVFAQTAGPVDLGDWTRWWSWSPGASWRQPQQDGADWQELCDHPVVHVGWEDAVAYAAWAGKRLPTEAEWEHAAGGCGTAYAWGAELDRDGEVMANTWRGAFPWRSDDSRGHHRTSPVGSYPANERGLHDMVGNVWEWTSTRWTPSHAERGADVETGPPRACCGGGLRPEVHEADRMVTKGGSHLCSPDYCRRYRPAARQGHGVRDSASHLGFRCVVDA